MQSNGGIISAETAIKESVRTILSGQLVVLLVPMRLVKL